jgi:cell division protein FtsX
MHHVRPSAFRVVVLNALAVIVLFTVWNIYQYALATLHLEEHNVALTLFLSTQTPRETIQQLEQKIQLLDDVETIQTTYPAQAKEQFALRFGAPSDTLLPVNPFPITMAIHFKTSTNVMPEFPALRAMSILLNDRSITNALTEYKVDTALIDRIQRAMRTLRFGMPIVFFVAVLSIIFMLISSVRNMLATIREEAYIMHIFGAQAFTIIRSHLLKLTVYAIAGVVCGSIVGVSGVVCGYILDSASANTTLTNMILEALTAQGANGSVLLIVAPASISIIVVESSMALVLGNIYVRRFSKMS